MELLVSLVTFIDQDELPEVLVLVEIVWLVLLPTSVVVPSTSPV